MSETIKRLRIPIPDADALDMRIRGLETVAHSTQNGCWGIYAPLGRQADLGGMPEKMNVFGHYYLFSFLRVAVRPLSALGGNEVLHLDAATEAGIITDELPPPNAKLSRLVINLHPVLGRVIDYTLQPLSELTVVEHEYGFRTCHEYDYEQFTTTTLRPRQGDRAEAALFDASEVPHAGIDGHYGHNVMAYHRVIPL